LRHRQNKVTVKSSLRFYTFFVETKLRTIMFQILLNVNKRHVLLVFKTESLIVENIWSSLT